MISDALNKTRLDRFDASIGFNRGKSVFFLGLWQLVKCLFFLTGFPWPNIVKHVLLNAFGAKIGSGDIIKPRVNIHFPWKLELGDNVWIGEGVEIVNFETVYIGSNSCISQQVFICSAGHNFRDPFFSYKNAPIVIESGVWLQARVFVCAGAVIGSESVVTACSLVKGHLPGNCIYTGNPAKPVSVRWQVIA